MILGVDSSSSTLAFVAVDGVGELVAAKYPLGSPFHTENVYKAFLAAGDFLNCHSLGENKVAFIEAPLVAGARNLQSTIKQALVSGGLQTALYEWEFTIHLVAVKSWKKSFVGNGSATKEQVQEAVREIWPAAAVLCGNDQDLFDAAAICGYGSTLVRRASRLVAEGSV